MLHKINTSTGSNSNIMPDLMNFNIRAGHCQELKLFHAVYYYVRDKKYATPLLQNMAILATFALFLYPVIKKIKT